MCDWFGQISHGLESSRVGALSLVSWLLEVESGGFVIGLSSYLVESKWDWPRSFLSISSASDFYKLVQPRARLPSSPCSIWTGVCIRLELRDLLFPCTDWYKLLDRHLMFRNIKSWSLDGTPPKLVFRKAGGDVGTGESNISEQNLYSSFEANFYGVKV